MPKDFFFNCNVKQLFSADATIFLDLIFLNFFAPENIEKCPQKLLLIGPTSVLPTGQKPAQISFFVP